jgi:hypothetical protein
MIEGFNTQRAAAYRIEAEKARALAAQALLENVQIRWLEIAASYEGLADHIDPH